MATLRSLGVPLAQARACASLQPVPGRMQRLAAAGQPLVAWTTPTRPTRWTRRCKPCAPGCASAAGGCGACSAAAATATPGKRPLMGAVAQQQADRRW